MKACIYIKKASRGRGRGATLALLKHCIGEGRSVKEIDDGQSRVAAFDAYGLAGAVDTAKLGDVRDNLLRQHHHGKSKELAKHVVLSVEDTPDPIARRAALRILRRMAKEFLRVYAPGCAALAFAHNDRLHPHLHLVISNSDGVKAIHWKPKELRRMQSMEWLSRDLALMVTSGRRKPGKAIRNPYPRAKLTLAAELAALPKDELEKISWEHRGNTRVFTFKGRRIRERTIERERQKYENEPKHDRPDEIPPGIAGTPELAAPRTATIERSGSEPAQAVGSGVAGGNRMGASPNYSLHHLLAQTLLELKAKRRCRDVGYNPPEIK